MFYTHETQWCETGVMSENRPFPLIGFKGFAALSWVNEAT